MKWTFELCKVKALKYDFKIDFLNGDKLCYHAAYKHGWLAKITKHMKISGDKFNRCIYSYEFSDKFVYVGLTANIDQRNEQHLSLRQSNNSQVIAHMKQTGLNPVFKQITDYMPYWKASKEEGVVLSGYLKKGWKPLNKNTTGSLGASNLFYTYEKCKEILKQAKYISDIYKKYPGLLIQCTKNKWLLDEISNLKRAKKPNGYWTLDKCIKLISENNYKTLKELTDNHRSAYNTAKENGFLKELKLIAKKRKGYWTWKTCLSESKKYKNRFSFQKGSRGAYKASYENGWLNDFF